MAWFDLASNEASLKNQYATDSAAQEFGRMLGQQRYSRQLADMNKQYTRGFPKFTGQWARRLGSGVESGVFKEGLGQNVSDYNQALQDVQTEASQFQSQFALEKAARLAAYQNALQMLREQFYRGNVGV